MLAKLLGRKIDHPLADIKAVQALLDDLPKQDALKSLMELTEWMESVASNSEFKLEHQLAVVRLLDETAYSYRRKLSRDYFSAEELASFQENRLWVTLITWYRTTSEAYMTIFNRYCDGDKGSTAIKVHLPLIAARTARIFGAYLKYSCVHYGPIDSKIWAGLGKIYRHAERNQYLDTSLSLYVNFPRLSSVKYEVAHMLGWYGCGVTSLSPLAMHLTEHIIAQYISSLDMTMEPTKNCIFGFDLAAATYPRRVNVDATIHPQMRFVCMSEIPAKLENLIGILNKNIVPEELVLGGFYDPQLVKEAADYLLQYITALPQRRTPRRNIQINTQVANGFSKTLECLNPHFDIFDMPTIEWRFENISASGFYTVLPHRGNEHVKIGQLVAIRPQGVSHWGVAVIRRLMRDDAEYVHVGAEILSNQVDSVALSQTHGGHAIFEQGQKAVWLHPKSIEEPNGRVCLLVRSYEPNCSLETELNGKKYLLIPYTIKQKHLDCDLVEFRMIEREESEE